MSARRPPAWCAAALRRFADEHQLDADQRADLVDAVIREMHDAADARDQQVLDDRWFAIAHRPDWERALMADG